MASRTSAIIAELLEALRTSHASIDLSTTDDTPRVLFPGMAILPTSSAPLLVVSAPSVRSSYQAGSAIGRYRVDAECEWTLFLASTHEDPAIRAGLALEGAHDVVSAIENAHADPSNETVFSLLELLITVEDVIGDELDDAPGFAIATGRITWADYPAGVGI